MSKLTLVGSENITRPTYEKLREKFELSIKVITILQNENNSYKGLLKIKEEKIVLLEKLLRKMSEKM
jgi:hypothetical protein